MIGRKSPHWPGDDPRAEDAEALDLQLHHVTGLQPAARLFRAEAEQAAVHEGARAEEVARKQLGAARRLRDQLRNRVVQRIRVAARELAAVAAGGHLKREPLAADARRKFIAHDQPWPGRRREVTALRRAQPRRLLAALPVAGTEAVDDRAAGNMLPRALRRDVVPAVADHDAESERVVEFRHARRGPDLGIVADHRVVIPKAERREFLPDLKRTKLAERGR